MSLGELLGGCAACCVCARRGARDLEVEIFGGGALRGGSEVGAGGIDGKGWSGGQ